MSDTTTDFESALAELEIIVAKLEQGDLALEQSLALFERGVQLSRLCTRRLEDAERRIEILTERGDVRPAPAALTPEDDLAVSASGIGTPAAPLPTWLEARRALVDDALAAISARAAGVPAGARHGGALQRARRRQAPASDAHARRRRSREPRRRRWPQRVALPAACAVELIHTYSLIHDDLPAMDDDSLRRGRPTSHVVFGEGMAILAGDGLLTEAFALLAREPASAIPTSCGASCDTIGIIATRGRRARHGRRPGDRSARGAPARAPRRRRRSTPDSLRDMHARKTGALITASASRARRWPVPTRSTVDAVERYGRELGLAFQIVDDVLDVEGTSAELGKTAGKDAAAGKPTYPALFGLERSKVLARDAIDRALEAPGHGGSRRPARRDRRLGRESHVVKPLTPHPNPLPASGERGPFLLGSIPLPASGMRVTFARRRSFLIPSPRLRGEG